jgi:hypothetical protein
VATTPPAATAAKFPSPESYTPKHLAEKILTSKAALEGERKQVTVLFADLIDVGERVESEDLAGGKGSVLPVTMITLVAGAIERMRVVTSLSFMPGNVISSKTSSGRARDNELQALIARQRAEGLVTLLAGDR